MLPVLTYTRRTPRATRSAGATRPSPRASARAQLGLDGARSRGGRSAGEECSGYWPAGRPPSTSTPTSPTPSPLPRRDRRRGVRREVGLELLVETARLWRSLGHHDADGGFRIDGVTGPDEYSAIADNNVYTNLMAQRNLLTRPTARAAPPTLAAALGVDEESGAPGATPPRRCSSPTTTLWAFTRSSRRASPATRAGTSTTPRPSKYPLLLHFPYFDLYRKQVVKQAGPGARDAPVRRRVHRGAEGAQLRLLRGADRARLVAVGLHPGGDRGRGRPPRPRLRLPRRGGADRPRRPARQHARRRPHRLAGGRVDRGRRRLRRHARAGRGRSRERVGIADALLAQLRRRGQTDPRRAPTASATTGPGRARRRRARSPGAGLAGDVCCWTGDRASIAANKVAGIRRRCARRADRTAPGAGTTPTCWR